jgi:hypothetical protein
MMMTNNKKMAMSIIKGSAPKEPTQGSSADYVDKGDGPKESVELPEVELDNSMGMEAAMAKFMLAVGAKDSKKAAQAMREFLAMYDEQEDESEDEVADKE